MTPKNNIPPDMDALLAWLKEQALEAHNNAAMAYKRYQKVRGFNASDMDTYKRNVWQKEAYSRVIAKIENSRVNQRTHVPKGWGEVD